MMYKVTAAELTNALKAAVEPMLIRARSIWITTESRMARKGTCECSPTLSKKLEAGRPLSRAKAQAVREQPANDRD